MKRDYPALIFLLIVALIVACKEENQPPTCKITAPANGIVYSVGEEIVISANSIDPEGEKTIVNFTVNNSDLGSLSAFPYTLYLSTENFDVGTYVVKCIASDNLGQQAFDEVKIELIEAENPPVAGFYGDPVNGTFPLVVNFVDTSENHPSSWYWEFGDGTTSDLQNPAHTYLTEGIFSVSLSVTNSHGQDMDTKKRYILCYDNGGLSGVPCPGIPIFDDVDGNLYHTVLIGDQCWMKENLSVTHYPNGNEIPYITDNDEWGELLNDNNQDAYCYYNNNVNSEYGALYTYGAAIADNWRWDNVEGQGICPDGWHLPTDDEWKILEGTVDTQFPVGDQEWDKTSNRGFDASKHLKTNNGWDINIGDNSSGFSALPGGARGNLSGVFINAESSSCFWTATGDDYNGVYMRLLYAHGAGVVRSDMVKASGFSIRCLKNVEKE